jgi:hypothetical protein
MASQYEDTEQIKWYLKLCRPKSPKPDLPKHPPLVTDPTTVPLTFPAEITSFPIMKLPRELRDAFYLSWLEAAPNPSLDVVNGKINNPTHAEYDEGKRSKHDAPQQPWTYVYPRIGRFYTPFKLLHRDPPPRKGNDTNAMIMPDPVLWNMGVEAVGKEDKIVSV